MLQDPRELGKRGEMLAAEYLLKANYRILERNWRFSKAEIDIIAEKSGVLIFIEVKTRSDTRFGEPESFISARKERMMQEAAAAYMVEKQYEWEIRFDVIGILLAGNGTFSLRHFEDVFF